MPDTIELPRDVPPSPSDRILVTGGTGLIGTALCRRLAESPAELHVAASSDRGTLPDGIRFHAVDLRDSAATRALVDRIQPTLVVDLASFVVGTQSVDLLEEVYFGVVQPSVHLMAALVGAGCARRVVHVGTFIQSPGPDGTAPSPYGAAKDAVRTFALTAHHLYGLPVVIAHPSYVYGPGQNDRQKLLPYVITSLLEGRDAHVGNGRRVTDWLYVDDCAEALRLALLTPGLAGTEIDIGSGEGVTVRDAAERVAELVGGPGRVVFGAVPDRRHERDRVVDPEPARRALGWQSSTSLDEGLARTVDHWREQLSTASGPRR